MRHNAKPKQRPENPNFSSGPCAKRPGWGPDVLKSALVGRSHRAPEARERLGLAIAKTKEILDLPTGYRVAIVPGSDTGAFEMALWTMLGARGVDVLAWEDFGKRWVGDIVAQLKVADARVLEADYGRLPDLGTVDFDRDVVFTWNGTSSGVRVPDGAWIAPDRRGLTFADATSAVFAQEIDWSKIDVATFSWQKVVGGEAAHGMLILSPRAVQRLESYAPPWPLPKLFRLTERGRLIAEIFEGVTINTPSMLCVEDYLDALGWAERIGALAGLRARADANAAVLFDWIERSPWIANLAVDPATRSNTSVCLRLAEPAVTRQGLKAEALLARRMVALLDQEGIAKDIGAYRTAPPGLRVWCGATVERSDLELLTPWLDWAFREARALLT
jgi:phosphoserine aminotransferase